MFSEKSAVKNIPDFITEEASVFFTALSCDVIRFLSVCCYHEDGKFDITDFIRIAKDYSKETEYSEKNMSVLLDEAYNNNYFCYEENKK